MLIDLYFLKSNIGKQITLASKGSKSKVKIVRLTDTAFVAKLIRKDKWNGVEMHFKLPSETNKIYGYWPR